MAHRSNPFAEIEQFFERMGESFDDPAREWRWPRADSMAVDVIEHDEEYVVSVDMPGFEKSDVAVRVHDHTLHITAERDEQSSQDGEYIRQERHRQEAERAVRLPGDVDTENVAAAMRNGILTVTLPKADRSEARRIEIEE